MKSLNTRFLTVLTTLVFLGFSVSAFAGKDCVSGDTRPKCNPDSGGGGGGGTSGGYTVTLIGGFSFTAVAATPGKKGGSLLSDSMIIMDRPSEENGYDQATWDGVFESCVPEGVLSDPVEKVRSNNWEIVNSGGKNIGTVDSLVTVRFHDISDDIVDNEGVTIRTADIDFNLFGRLDYEGQFLPSPGWTHCVTLHTANIFGDGGDRGLACISSGVSLAGSPVILEICHKDDNGACATLGDYCPRE